MSRDLTKLPAFNDDGELHVVVESPRGAGVKLKYDPDLGAFEYGKALPIGLTYPYDWGFVPGTEAEDGDPLDALVLTDVPSYPGVVIACRPLGILQLDEKDEEGKKKSRERNDRLVAVPVKAKRFEEMEDPDDLSARLRDEIERFFLNTTFFSAKDPRVLGWKGPKYAEKKVRQAIKR
ncbi:MAG: inorganic diphosphatase [Myxococcales bacterium]|nr:inorganic diphosphatase [Myxococcales bacterium]